MKVKLTIELELPAVVDPLTSVEEIVERSYINYVVIQHLRDAIKWSAKGKDTDSAEDVSAKVISNYHSTWATICEKAKWTCEVE